VVADLVDVVRALTADPENRVPHLAFQPGALSDLPVLPMAEVRDRLLPAPARPRPAGRAGRRHAHPRRRTASASRRSCSESRIPTAARPVIILTHQVREGDMNARDRRIEALPPSVRPVTRIRMESLAR
jgi:homoserine dehydrogenase